MIHSLVYELSSVPGIYAISEIVNILEGGSMVSAIAACLSDGIINSIVPKSPLFVFSAAPPGALTLLSFGSSANI